MMGSAVTSVPSKQTEPSPVVFVVDDDPSVRAALEDLFESAGLQSMSFGSAEDFVSGIGAVPSVPGCVVLDIRMPGQSGLDLQGRLSGMGLQLPVIIITGHGDVTLAVRAMKQGAIDFLPKPFGDQELLDAVHAAIQRDRTRRDQEAVVGELRDRWLSLSAGERDVMDGVVRGLLNKQIARELGVREITVRVRRSRIMRKMRADSVADLVRIAETIDRASNASR
jgi:FixJ family two-component response regulator